MRSGSTLIRQYDLTREYGLAQNICAKSHFTGYLDASSQLVTNGCAANSIDLIPNQNMVLCMLGGGQDGAQLASAFSTCRLPQDTNGILLTGPDLPAAEKLKLHHRAAQNPRLQVLDFISTPLALVERADKVIAMGGYNTVYELLSLAKRPLIIPRVKPRQEQLIRARRLKELNLIDMLHPEQLDAAQLSAWLSKPAL